jgi:uncharacterized protein (DUF433 family)
MPRVSTPPVAAQRNPLSPNLDANPARPGDPSRRPAARRPHAARQARVDSTQGDDSRPRRAGAEPIGPSSRGRFRAQLLRDLGPRGILEELAAERVVTTAWGLRQAIASDPGSTEDAYDVWADALELWHRLRPPVPGLPEPAPTTGGVISPPVVARLAAGEPDDDHWRNRLSFDPAVSADSPSIVGTRLTVGDIVSMIVDGRAWADILRDHPELSEADIRAALAWTVEQDDMAAPAR